MSSDDPYVDIGDALPGQFHPTSDTTWYFERSRSGSPAAGTFGVTHGAFASSADVDGNAVSRFFAAAGSYSTSVNDSAGRQLRAHELSVRLLCNRKPIVSKDGKPIIGRASICLCHRGRYASVTIRTDGKVARPDKGTTSVARRVRPWGVPIFTDNKRNISGQEVEPEIKTVSQQFRNLVQAPVVASFLHRELRLDRRTGLVLINGGTSSSKSTFATAIALEIIRAAVEKQYGDSGDYAKCQERWPHLVTFEDPIEKWNVFTPTSGGWAKPGEQPDDLEEHDLAAEAMHGGSDECLGFCFTPRERGRDVDSLVDCVRDAKRQTPTCLYVGEVRRKEDWRALLEFAGSGHLVVATTHAGSLSESLSRAFDAMSARTPAARRSVASSILACLHFVRKKVEYKDKDENGTEHCVECREVLPNMWRHESESLNSLVVDGLSAVVPNRGGVLARGQFLEEYLISFGQPSATDDHGPWGNPIPDISKARLDAVKNVALKLDHDEWLS